MIKLEKHMQLVYLQQVVDDIEVTQEMVANINPLLFCHTTKYDHIDDICYEKKIKTTECTTFKHMAVFFFYGKAKYISSKEIVDEFGKDFPITFLFEGKKFKNDKVQLFPFDTGGFLKFNKYDLKTEKTAANFKFEPSYLSLTNTIKKYIYILYTSNEGYIDKKITEFDDKYSSCVTMNYIKTIHDRLQSRHSEISWGEQALTLEVQVLEDVNFNDSTPHAIFVPDCIYQSDRAIRSLGFSKATEIVPYNAVGTSIEDYVKMREAIKLYITKYDS